MKIVKTILACILTPPAFVAALLWLAASAVEASYRTVRSYMGVLLLLPMGVVAQNSDSTMAASIADKRAAASLLRAGAATMITIGAVSRENENPDAPIVFGAALGVAATYLDYSAARKERKLSRHAKD